MSPRTMYCTRLPGALNHKAPKDRKTPHVSTITLEERCSMSDDMLLDGQGTRQKEALPAARLLDSLRRPGPGKVPETQHGSTSPHGRVYIRSSPQVGAPQAHAGSAVPCRGRLTARPTTPDNQTKEQELCTHTAVQTIPSSAPLRRIIRHTQALIPSALRTPPGPAPRRLALRNA